MVAPHEAEINLDTYARLAVALARAGAARQEVLAAHGLDEDRWQAIDDGWQARISGAIEAVGEEDAVAPLLEQYARAMERAQAHDGAVLALERFAEATRVVRSGVDVARRLERLGVTMEDYLRANRHWIRRMTEDEDIAAAFRRALG